MWSAGDRVEEGVPDLCLEFILCKRDSNHNLFSCTVYYFTTGQATCPTECWDTTTGFRIESSKKRERCEMPLWIRHFTSIVILYRHLIKKN